MTKQYPKRRRRKVTRNRQADETQPLQPAILMEPTTALQAAIFFLELLTHGPVDYTDQALLIMRTVVTLWAVASQMKRNSAEIIEATELLVMAAGGPVDISGETDRIFALIDRMVMVKPGRQP